MSSLKISLEEAEKILFIFGEKLPEFEGIGVPHFTNLTARYDQSIKKIVVNGDYHVKSGYDQSRKIPLSWLVEKDKVDWPLFVLLSNNYKFESDGLGDVCRLQKGEEIFGYDLDKRKLIPAEKINSLLEELTKPKAVESASGE